MSDGLFGIHAAALKAQTSGMDTERAANTTTVYRVPVMPSLDGNTVELSTEQIAFSANAVGYASTFSFISDSVGEITRALKGD